ncbi:unnamed protein product [Cuscuta campestris]|uniref:Uncharacterized protein n=1 Tax=Cuscuta campestris TaxID=132261 RepID=A0A484M739_9ASTE|nr:unnamed protein product [Cuscuta campestris]
MKTATGPHTFGATFFSSKPSPAVSLFSVFTVKCRFLNKIKRKKRTETQSIMASSIREKKEEQSSSDSDQ